MPFGFGFQFGFARAAADVAISYLSLSALNASNTAPLTSLVGDDVTQVATGAVTIPAYVDEVLGADLVDAGIVAASWTASGTSTIADDDGAVKITYTDHVNGGYLALSAAGDLSAALVVGQRYRINFNAKKGTGSPSPRADTGDTVAVTTTDYAPYTFTFVATSATNNVFYAYPGVGGSIWIKDVVVRASTAAGLHLTTIAANNPAIPGAGYRDSAWYATDSAGAAIATPTVLASGLTRYDGSGLGVLAEYSETLYGRYPRDLTQSTYWTASNITPLKNATGYDGVVNSASTITAGANDGTILQSATVASGARGFFPYVKRKTGTGVVSVTLDNGSTWTPITVTAGWTRVALTQTVTNPVYGFKLATSGDAIEVDYCNVYSTAVATSVYDNASTGVSVTRPPRYTSIPGTNLGSKLNFVLYSYEALAAGGRDVTLFSDGTRHVKYQGAAGLLVARDESQVMGADVLGGKGTFDDAAYFALGTGATVSGGKLTFASVASNAGASKASIYTLGKTYLIQFTIDSITEGGIRVYAGSGAIGTSRTTAGTYSQAITCAGDTTLRLYATGTTSAVIDNLTITEVAELTADLDIAESTQTHIGLDLGTAASMSVNSVEVATATFPAAVEWGETVYIGSKVVTGTASETLSGTLTILQSSSDAKFDPASED